MYKLLKLLVYSKPQDPVDQEAAAQIIKEYYDTGVKELNNELKEIYEGKLKLDTLPEEAAAEILKTYDEIGLSVFRNELESVYQDKLEESKSVSTADEIRNLEQTRHVLYSEIVYYRLRHDTPQGLRRYYRYAHQAAINGEDQLLKLLYIELVRYLSEINDESYLPFVHGLLTSYAILEAVAIRGSNRRQLVQNIQSSIDQINNISNSEKKILKALLMPWDSVSDVFSGRYESGKQTLDEALLSLSQVKLDQNDWRTWFRNVALEFSHRQYGYLFRVQGEISKAISEYLEALKSVREVHFLSEEATLRNDLGLAQAEIGQFMDSRGNIRDGLQRRFELGDGRRIVLSLSSWAQYALREGSYFDAFQYARKAFEIAEIMQDQRAKGLALIALSEANRRIAYTIQDAVGSVKRRMLYQAKIQADQALQIFTSVYPENSRAVDALIEKGCAARDLLRVKMQDFLSNDYELDELKQEADQAFKDAAARAGEKILYRKVDALVNRVWLAYYAHDEGFLTQAIKDAEEAFDPSYFFQKNGKPALKEGEANQILWSQLGKLFVCRGHVDFDKWMNNSTSTFGEEAVKNYLLGLEYSGLFSPDHRGLRQGREGIFIKLNELDKDKLTEVAVAVKKCEKQTKITKRSLLRELMQNRGLWYL
jgi:hypothetical protein